MNLLYLAEEDELFCWPTVEEAERRQRRAA